MKRTAALDLPPHTLGRAKAASQHGRDALTPSSQVCLHSMLAQQLHHRRRDEVPQVLKESWPL